MLNLPTGTITFVFTDIEGSTVRWERYPSQMRVAVARHDALLHALMQTHHGHVFKTVGDAFYAAFPSASDALEAALAIQLALAAEVWAEEVVPLRVRMALHTGEAEQRGSDYFGQALNRVARILASGHGGQVLLSRTTLSLVRDAPPQHVEFRDMGMHHLKDIQHPVQIFQVVHPDLRADCPPLKTQEIRPTNLPPQLMSCVGRDEELAALRTLLLDGQVRLVTLSGPGGVGKTRLSLQVAASLAETFPDGLWYVDLATAHDARRIESLLAQALGIHEIGPQTVLEQVQARLDGRVLLVLDSFEQPGQRAGALLAALLQACPGLKVLVCSRLLSGYPGEYVYYVTPLALPSIQLAHDPAELLRFGAVALFVQQAQAVRPDFCLTRANAATIVKICTKLDGLPLAVELAAARVSLLSLPTMLKRLDHQLRFFTGPQRHALQQRTLQGTIEWSYELLGDGEKRLLHQLVVFKSSCTFEAIEAICAPGRKQQSAVLGMLTSLTEKSFLRQQEGSEGELRFRLLYIMREYIVEHGQADGEEEERSARHAAYYLALAEEIAPTLVGIEQRSALANLEEEHENMQAALAWYIAHGQVEAGLRLAQALGRFWWMHGHMREGRQWLARLLTAEQVEVAASALRAQAFVLACRMASNQQDYGEAAVWAEQALVVSMESGDQHSISQAATAQAEIAFHKGQYEEAARFLEQSLSIQRALGDRRATASLLNNLGNVVLQQGLLAQAARFHEESLRLFRQVGDAWAISTVLIALGEVERRRANYRQAGILYEESLRLCRSLGSNEGCALSLVSLGDLARYQGDNTQAALLYKQSLPLFQQLGDKIGVTLCLQGLAEVAYGEDQLARATRLFAQAEVTAYSLETTMLRYEQATHQETIARLRAALDRGSFEGFWMTGQAMTLEQAAREALEEGGGARDA